MILSQASPFNNRSFAIFWCSRVLTSLAFQMHIVAVGWQLYALTGDPLDLGLVGLVQFAPVIMLVLVTGQVADRFDRRYVVLASRLALMLCLLWLAWWSHAGAVRRSLVFVIVFLIGVCQAFQMPSSQAMIPTLVSAPQLPAAIAWGSIGFQGATVVGPALGGFLYLAGPTVVYGVSAAFYLLSALMVLAVEQRFDKSMRKPVTRESLFAGFTFIWSQPVILGAISLDLFMVLLGGATALMPIFAGEILAVGPWGLGLLRAAPGVGAMLTALVFAVRPLRRRVGRWMFLAAAGFGLCTIGFGLSTNLWVSLAVLVLLGASDMINIVIRQSIVQLDTPDAMRGRVSSVNGVFVGASNRLGEFESGITAAWLGAVPATVLGGVGTLLVAALWLRWFPALWNRDGLQRSSHGAASGRAAPTTANAVPSSARFK